MSATMAMFASCLPGLEDLLRKELADLGIADPRVTAGGVVFTGGLPELYRANLCTGIATHVLLRVAEFRSLHLANLRKKADPLPWRDVFAAGQPFAVRATCRRSKLYHSGAVAERVAQAITQSTGAELAAATAVDSGDESPAEIPVAVVRVVNDVVTISIDTSGAPLHRRGWRLQTAKAPLREDLARALLRAARWDPTTTLVDPMTGSGTLPIEAAILARGLAPGRGRTFAFEKMPLCDAPQLAALRVELDAAARTTAPAPIFGSDRDAGAIDAARANAERAGVLGDLALSVASLGAAPVLAGEPAPSARGSLVCNPPYGHRVGRAPDLRNLYQALGHAARGLPAEWTVGLYAADRRLALRTGLALDTAFLTAHGGLKIRALTCSLAANGATSV